MESMRDPKVEILVDKFYNKLTEVNAIWNDLVHNGVYVSITVEGDYTPGSTKRIVVDRIDQNVSYKRQPKK